MKFVQGIIAGWFILAVMGLLYVFSGVHNVAASDEHSAFGRWVLATTIRHSIDARANTPPPADIGAAWRANRGALHFNEHCASCHGGPGVEPSEGATYMRPQPPDLSDVAQVMPATGIYWVIKNGITMSGMPAWGSLHSDSELWDLVSFVMYLPDMSADAYRSITRPDSADTSADTSFQEKAQADIG